MKTNTLAHPNWLWADWPLLMWYVTVSQFPDLAFLFFHLQVNHHKKTQSLQLCCLNQDTYIIWHILGYVALYLLASSEGTGHLCQTSTYYFCLDVWMVSRKEDMNWHDNKVWNCQNSCCIFLSCFKKISCKEIVCVKKKGVRKWAWEDLNLEEGCCFQSHSLISHLDFFFFLFFLLVHICFLNHLQFVTFFFLSS